MDDKVKLCSRKMIRVIDVGKGYTGKPWLHPDRKLDHNVFLYITGGVFRVVEESVEYNLEKGDVFFLKSGMHHWGEQPIDANTSWYWIHFYDGICNSCKYDFECHDDSDTGMKKDMYLIELFKKEKNILYTLESKLEEIISINSKLDASLVSYKLMIDINHQLQLKSSNKKMHIANKIAAYLKDTLYERNDSISISRALNMNYEYLSRIFKSCYGTTVSHYRNKLKINEAVRLLKSTNLNINEISDCLKFENQFYFSKVFKQQMGKSPMEYIKDIYRSV